MSAVPTVTLHGGVEMPRLGLGVFEIANDEATEIVAEALEAGYRSIDTAAAYGNERGVGAAIAASDLPRSELFVTTKVWNDDHGRERTRAALRASLERLGLDQVDLYLIHWPVPSRDRYLETWEALVELREEGLARAVGVSNFEADHLERIISGAGVVPALNQVELHPRLQQTALRSVHASYGIVTEAWSPLAKGELLDDPAIGAIAERLERSPAQVVLRWHLQLGNVVIPKSATPSRIRDNIEVFDFELDNDDLETIAKLDDGTRVGPHPEQVT